MRVSPSFNLPFNGDAFNVFVPKVVTSSFIGKWRSSLDGIGDQAREFNPYHAKLIYLYFQPLVVSRYRDPQPKVVENYTYLFNLRPNNYKS